MHDYTAQLIQIMSRKFGLPPETLAEGGTFEDIGFDSLALIELSLTIEKEFGVRLASGQLTPSQTVAEAAAVVEAACQRVPS
jgi:acyl carrier protein